MKQWPFTSKSEFYLILNMGLGDPGTWAGAVDDANMPAVMEVDWIRVSTIESGE
ncbi:MAG: beta-glucanase, partial [Candidatus Cryptobacteroides sp.]|nr:beta-glucanase [Candidatus Cryptobacteroides sp.]